MLTRHLPWKCRVKSKLFKQIRNGEFNVPTYLSNFASVLIKNLMNVDSNKRLTIEEALNHPFLKYTSVKKSIFEYKYISLWKTDLFLGVDEEYEYNDVFNNEKQNCESY